MQVWDAPRGRGPYGAAVRPQGARCSNAALPAIRSIRPRMIRPAQSEQMFPGMWMTGRPMPDVEERRELLRFIMVPNGQ
jgi:uncharacterized protein involved in type VI secretion and phage assembly